MLLAALIFGVLFSSGYVNALTLENFFGYPFGQNHSYQVFPANHDHVRGVSVPVPFPYFGRTFNHTNIDDSGYVSFLNLPRNTTLGTPFTPRDFPFTITGSARDWSPIVAVYWADVSTRHSGLISYKNITANTDEALINKISTYIGANLPSMRGYQATWALIITWDHVGYVTNVRDDKFNTFQMVISTNGMRSAAIFLYAENGINWVTSDHNSGASGFGGNRAIAGYNVGDGVHYYKLPGSQTDDMEFLDSIPGNTGRNGEWVFRLDVREPVSIGCQTSGILSIFPTAGNVLGGTPVVVSGPCIPDPGDIECIFGDQSTKGKTLSNQTAFLCTTPELRQIGRIPFSFVVHRKNGEVFRGYTSFQSVSFDRGHEVDVMRSDLRFDSKLFDIKWNKNILPFEPPENYEVEIYLFELNTNDGTLSGPVNVAKGVNNTGETRVRVPSLRNAKSLTVPVLLKVVPSDKSDRRRKQINLDPRKSTGVWSGLFFGSSDGFSVQILRKECDKWFRSQSDGGELLRDTIPCPPTLAQARLPNSGLVEVNMESVFQATQYGKQFQLYRHPNTETCFQQRTLQSDTSTSGQECCYDSEGGLVVGPPGGGNVNKQAPLDFMSSVKHIVEDFIPYLQCCKAGTYSQCNKFYERRPSDDGRRYQPPPPACIYGDPHIVTLDGHKYTFNGKGEFTMIQTEDDMFTLQGRMVEATNTGGSKVPATVFSALAAKAWNSDTIQIELVEIGLRALVNGEEVNFGDSQQNAFNNVTITDLGNQTMSAVFTSGPYVEVKVQNAIISVVVVSLPVSMQEKTKGLMGNYNGNISDDLKPNNNVSPLPLSASLQDIHEKFGITWIINTSNNSLFTYRGNDSWSDFYHPDFTPLFEAVFNDSSLENTTYKICKDDLFCIFDIAATRRTEIGMATLQGTQDLEMIVEMSKPVVCDPTCDHGVCISTNSCNCAAGYSGPTCSVPDVQPCEDNICLHGGNCTQAVLTTTCDCPEGFSGTLCENIQIKPEVTIIHTFTLGYVLRWTVPEDQAHQVNAFQISTYRIEGSKAELVERVELFRAVRAYAFHNRKPNGRYRSEVRAKVGDQYGPPGVIET